MTAKLPDGVQIGTLMRITPGTAVSGLTRDMLAQESLRPHVVPLTDFRIWDNINALLPAASATDDLGLYGNTFGTGSPTIATGDVKTLTVTRYARVQIPIPANFDDADVVLRIHAGMDTTVADTSCTLDVEAYRSDEEGSIGSDLCTTAATSINSLTAADVDFVISAGTLSAGDVLDVRLTIAAVDAASGTAVIAEIGNVKLLVDSKG